MDRLQDRVGDAMIAVGTFLAGIAPLMLLVELVEWGATGQWPGRTIEDGLMLFGLERPLAFFDATQFVLDLVVSLPLALGLYLFGYMLFSAALRMETPAGA
jgi:hypothetical protein